MPVDFRMSRGVVHKADFFGPPGVTEECLDDSIEHRDRKFQSLASSHSLSRKHPADRYHPLFLIETGTQRVGVQTDLGYQTYQKGADTYGRRCFCEVCRTPKETRRKRGQ